MDRFWTFAGLLAVASIALLTVACAAEEPAATPQATPAAIAPTPIATPVSTPAAQKEPTVKQWSQPPAVTIDPAKKYTAVLKTSNGNMVVELFASEVPKTVNNFVFLSKQGFYDGVKFHRIVKNFMVQTGDPTGTGTGGPGYRFADEPVARDYVRGTVAMANAGPNTNGSQFFIVHQNYPLPKNYVIFGRVIQGLEVLDSIADTPVTVGPTGERSLPTKTVTITSVEVQEAAAGTDSTGMGY
ncbi:MAG: peptidylprolyl isomerase [Chloroflexi bacterium]|nr:peptidylprolyl isomerase [Chloroflexota bacterium]